MIYVVWQKVKDSGSIKQTATLPSFVGDNTPTIIAQDGATIQIPISQQEQKAGITLQEQINTLIQQPEYSYLNQFIDKQDVTWQEITLAEDSWDYKQEGLTPAGAALVAIAVGIATGGTASGIANTVAANAGSQTVGAMAGAAFSSLTTQASVTLINNKGDVGATLKELGSKDSVKQLTFAMASAGMSHKIDKGLVLKDINITQTGFDQRMVKAIADSTSTSLLQTAVYGSDLKENLKNNLTMQLATVATQETFSNIVKDLDSDTLSDNIAHKIAAGLTGCLSVKAAGNDCSVGAIGATIGEMWGDWHTDNPNTLTQNEKEKLIGQAKLIAGIAAAYAGKDVNVAADMAVKAVRWNGAYINKGSMSKNQQAECRQLGISTSDCGKYHGEKNLETLRQIGFFILPTTPEEIAIAIVTGGAGGYVVKAGGKILSKIFKNKDEAKKVLAEAKGASRTDTKVGYEPDNNLLSNQASKKARDEKLIKEAENISTAKPNGRPPQVTAPRNIQEQILWNEVIKNPKTAGKPLNGMNNDPRFPKDAGFQKMEAKMRSNDGKAIVIHYQYNYKTNNAYDIKITSAE